MMTQTDFIQNEIKVLNKIAEEYLEDIHIINNARNIALDLIRAKKRELKRFMKWEKRFRREAHVETTQKDFHAQYGI
jgi:hypothetical protein